MEKAGLGGREGKHRAGKRKRPAAGRGSGVPAWGTSLSWKDVTPADSLSVLVGSDEGGFLSLEEIDGDVFQGTTLDAGSSGNLLGTLPIRNEDSSEREAKNRKKGAKRPIARKSDDSKAVNDAARGQLKKAQEAGPSDAVGAEGLIESKPLSEITPKPMKLKKTKKKKSRLNKLSKDNVPLTVEQSPKVEKFAKVDQSKGFVLGPVVGISEATQESTLKDSESDKSVVTEAKSEDCKQKKVKRGSKARKIAKLQKQHAGVKGGNKSTGNSRNDGRITDEDLQKREELELERLEKEANAKCDLLEEAAVEAFDMSAWAELRLHPLLEKALSLLRFVEPTSIQKACIPAAAHQGKDVIGAAETGSGKTLAFGIPIIQRLLDEQEKLMRQLDSIECAEEAKMKYTGTGSPLRALIVTPTRELALQVCDHLRAVAKYTSIKVVPIVGGMAPQKQQRLLKYQPQVVVGTPGRLWELMSVGETHLLDLSFLSFFVLDEADRMVERGHFKELQSIIDMLPKTNRQRPQEPKSPKGSKRQREKPRKKPREKSPEVYLDSDDNEQSSDKEDEEDEEEGGGGQGDEEPAVEDVDMDSTFPTTDKKESTRKRQTLVFSATLALPSGFKKKLKRGFLGDKDGVKKNEYSVASLSERAGMNANAVIIDLTTKNIVAKKLEESVIECREEEKDAYLYYVLKVHGYGRTLIFCTSIAALRRVSAILRLLEVPVWPLHAQMQQKQRLKAMDRFKANEDCVMVATDVAARGLDVAGIRTVIHYQLPHSAEMYVHRSGRTARADTDGCSIALISPSDRAKYNTLCRALSKTDGLPSFPVDAAYVPATLKRVSLALRVDKVLRKHQQAKAKQSWLHRHAEALEIDLQNSDDDAGGGSTSLSLEKRELLKVHNLQQELHDLLNQPLEPKAFSRRYITGSGITPLLAKQLKEYTTTKTPMKKTKRFSSQSSIAPTRGKLVVIGQEANEPLDALRRAASLRAEDSTPKSKRSRR